MRLFQPLWKLIQTYFHYRKGTEALRTGEGGGESQDVIMKAFMKGDYRIAAMRSVDPFFRGLMMMQFGHFPMARKSLEYVVANTADPKSAALANCVLGQILMEQGEDDRAMECFRTSQILSEERGGADRGIAELLLRSGGSSDEALRAARSGVEKERAIEGSAVDSKDASLSEQLGTLAWAVAVESHDAAEVDQLVAEGVGLPGVLPVNSVARMHLHFGYAYAALGDPGKSIHHLEEAARIDPNGLAGRAAAAPIAARA
jgi:tetratricopeptide (TPR) repeat protein